MKKYEKSKFSPGIKSIIAWMGWGLTPKNRRSLFASIPPFFLDCVVAIGIAGNPTTQWGGTGFLYGDLNQKDKKYDVYLVTNGHVANPVKEKDNAILRFNPKGDGEAQEIRISNKSPENRQLWASPSNPNVDVAVLPLSSTFLKMLDEKKIKYSYFRSDKEVIDRKQAKKLNLSAGDEVFILGFPISVPAVGVGTPRNDVIVRHGTIATIKEALEGKQNRFYVDALVFPGNSGGPVINKPEFNATQGTQALNTAKLIGVVGNFSFYPNSNVINSNSDLTKKGQQPIVINENSGLAYVIPTDFIKEAIEEYKKVHR